jgi:predicted nucleic acid-binding Zn finger protein
LFKQDLAYVAYVKDALEFYEVDRIFVSENNVNSIFAKINFNGKVLTVRLAASDM